MAELEPIYLTATSYPSKSRLMSSQKLYNMYAENTIASSPFKNPILYNTPGSVLWATIPNNYNEVYGFIVMNEYLYVVCGVKVYKIDKNKNITEIGEMATTPAEVQMTENGLQVTILTSGGIAYYYTESTNTFGQIVDVNFPVASAIVSLDGYTIASEKETGTFYVSDLRDTTSWSALASGTAEALSDNIITMAVFNRQLFFLGEKSIEIWYDSGVSAQPFRPINQTFIQRGCIAAGAVTTGFSGLFWVGEDESVYQTVSYQPRKISTFAIDYEISKIPNKQDIQCYIYDQEGHEFLVITSKSANKTWCYDISTEQWHHRGSLSSGNITQIYWGADNAILFNGQIIVSGIENGKLFYLDTQTFTENGRTITAEVTSATIFRNFNDFSIDNLVLIMESGVGLNYPEQGNDPLVDLFYSTDGGNTWLEKGPLSIGKIGEYKQEIRWPSFGKAREFILRFRITDPVRRTIIGCYGQFSGGNI